MNPAALRRRALTRVRLRIASEIAAWLRTIANEELALARQGGHKDITPAQLTHEAGILTYYATLIEHGEPWRDDDHASAG